MSNNIFPVLDASPSCLRYVAALRGIVPAPSQTPFTYLQAGFFDTEDLLCLAASNPEGTFFGLLEENEKITQAQACAMAQGITNLTFGKDLFTLSSKIDFLCFDSPQKCLSQEEQATLFDRAEKILRPNGLFCLRYKAYETEEQLLEVLLANTLPEIQPSQHESFLQDIKAMGQNYFAHHADSLAALHVAIDTKLPEAFFEKFKTEKGTVSKTMEICKGLVSRDFAYVGDANISSNYIEMSVPAQAQEPLLARQNQALYEPTKDFTLNRLVRNDIWVRLPSTQSSHMPDLFDSFTFGITTPVKKIPTSFKTQSGSVIDLQTPLFISLITLMTKLPLGIGDFAAHPTGMVFGDDAILASLQILLATGIAHPMRGRYELREQEDVQIVPTKSINSFLNNLTISTPSVRFASPVAGSAITLSAREALVLQAISRVGLNNSVGSLFEELELITKQNPALASKIMDTAQPSHEMADEMLRSVLDHDIMRWYAYGLMAA